MEKTSEDDVEMKNDESKEDSEHLALVGEEISKTENDLPSPDSVEEDEALEKDKNHSMSIGQVVLLLDNKCLSFEVLVRQFVAIFAPLLSLFEISRVPL